MLHYVPKTEKVANELIRPNTSSWATYSIITRRIYRFKTNPAPPYFEKKPEILIADWCFGFYDVALKRQSLEKNNRPCFPESSEVLHPEKGEWIGSDRVDSKSP